MEIFEMVLQAVGQHVFPIVVCVFLLWERHTTTKEMNETMEQFSNNILENTTLLKSMLTIFKENKVYEP